ncbi:MAG: T9SS type A sorting domain-containing protein [Clostridia bacterium]|nr:T9SS type A sorting domain-containing protein [Clostridia bacterium]
MKNFLITIFILSIIPVMTNAQDGFVVKSAGPEIFNVPQDMLIKPDNNMLFMFSSVPEDGSELYTTIIRELNPAGEVVNSYSYADSLHDYVEFTHLLLLNDTLYLLGWGYKIPEPNISNTIFRMQKLDLQLNLIDEYKIWLEELYSYGVGHGRAMYANGRFYYVNSYGSSSIVPFYIEVSKQGELLNFKAEGLDGSIITPYDFDVKADGAFQVFIGVIELIGFPDFSGVIGKYNANFELENYLPLPYDFFNFFTHESLNDSIYYLSGQWMKWGSNSLWRAGLVKMKNDTTVLNSFIYSSYLDSAACPAYRQSIEVLPDGNLILCFTGDILVQFFPQLQPAKINLIKLSPNLEVIWHRYIGEPDAKYDAYEVHVNSEGEIVILAAYSPAPWTNFYDMSALFIKTDKHGLITGTNDALHKVNSTEAVVFPNPAHDVVYVEYSLAYASATFTLTDINGKTMLEKTLLANKANIDISSLPAGTYVYRVSNQNGLNESGKIVVK